MGRGYFFFFGVDDSKKKVDGPPVATIKSNWREVFAVADRYGALVRMLALNVVSDHRGGLVANLVTVVGRRQAGECQATMSWLVGWLQSRAKVVFCFFPCKKWVPLRNCVCMHVCGPLCGKFDKNAP